MSSIHPFFSPSNRGFHPQMTLCLLQEAAIVVLGDTSEGRVGVHFLELLRSYSLLLELGKCLPRNQLPVRTVEEIHEEFLRLRRRWARVVELKIVEAGLRNIHVRHEARKITFLPKEYAFHVKVIYITNYILL
jgi:uncharacterized protein (DUF2344 family)